MTFVVSSGPPRQEGPPYPDPIEHSRMVDALKQLTPAEVGRALCRIGFVCVCSGPGFRVYEQGENRVKLTWEVGD